VSDRGPTIDRELFARGMEAKRYAGVCWPQVGEGPLAGPTERGEDETRPRICTICSTLIRWGVRLLAFPLGWATSRGPKGM
jgi:hypothetical protein